MKKQKESSGRALAEPPENRLLELYLKFMMPRDEDKARVINSLERRVKILNSITGF